MTYLEKALQEKEKVANALIEDSCPGRVVHGAPISGNDNGCLMGRIAIEPCVECWNREMPGAEGDCHDQSEDWSRNDSKEADSFPELPVQLKSSSVDALIQLLNGQIEHWEAMRNSYAYVATVAQARKPGDCHDQCAHWSRNDSGKAETLAGKIKACEALVDKYKALSLELEKYREVCGYGWCD